MKNVFIFAQNVMIIGLCLVSCSNSKEKTAQESPENTSVPIEIAQVENRTVQHILSYTGIVEAWEELDVVPNISGKIARIYVKEGDRVKKGDLLAELDTDPMKLSLAQAQANLHAAEAAYADAEKNSDRMSELIKDGTISPQQHEKTQLAYESAKAVLEQAKTAVDMAEYNLRVSVMRAPFDGVITHKTMNEGETINPMMPGGSGVVTLMDISKVKVRVLAPDTDLPYLTVGLRINAQVDAYPDETFKGTVYTVSPGSARQSRLFEVQLQIPNAGMKLKPGMFGRIDVIVEEKKDVPVIQQVCLVSAEPNPFVFVVSGGKAHRREVVTGIMEDDMVEVVSGLQTGETVVRVGQAMLHDGSSVEIKGGEAR